MRRNRLFGGRGAMGRSRYNRGRGVHFARGWLAMRFCMMTTEMLANPSLDRLRMRRRCWFRTFTLGGGLGGRRSGRDGRQQRREYKSAKCVGCLHENSSKINHLHMAAVASNDIVLHVRQMANKTANSCSKYWKRLNKVAAPTMNRADFERQFLALQRSADAPVQNTGLIACANCTACTDCTFCVRCTKTERSHYCEDVQSSSELRHCRESTGCARSSHLVLAKNCRDSAYLIKCRDCANCTYCFGCVGLRGKDFHILNVAHDRESYFRTTRELALALGVELP
jgi:hypothetical protein